MVTRRMPRKLAQDKIEKIVVLRALDYPKQEIADRVGVSRTTVNNRLKEFREAIESKNRIEKTLEIDLDLSRKSSGGGSTGQE